MAACPGIPGGGTGPVSKKGRFRAAHVPELPRFDRPRRVALPAVRRVDPFSSFAGAYSRWGAALTFDGEFGHCGCHHRALRALMVSHAESRGPRRDHGPW